MKAQTNQTKFSLENIVRLSSHPNGFRRFMDGVNYELELGHLQSSMNVLLAKSCDIIKYLFYVTIIGKTAYELLK